MAYVENDQSIGTTGRDFSTVASWEASLPADLTTGDGRTEIGTMFPDTDFTETNTTFNVTTSNMAQVILRANESDAYNGKKNDGNVLWKPTSGATQLLHIRLANMVIYGIEFDGSDGGFGGAANGLCILATNAANPIVERCCAHDNGNGPGFAMISSQSPAYAFCISHDNSTYGFSITQSADVKHFCCGTYNNTTGGYHASNANRNHMAGCWSFSDGFSADNALWTFPERSGFNLVDDTVFTDNSSTQYGIVESAVEAAANFVDVTNRDFKVTSGSSLLAIGPLSMPNVPTFYGGVNIYRDVGGSSITLSVGQRFDIGPHQLSHAPAIDAPAPGKATSVTATPGDARLEMGFTTPANPAGGTTDRVGFAISTTSSAAVSLADGGNFAAVVRNLVASTVYSGRSLCELVGGANLVNGVDNKVIVVPGNSDDVFNTAAVEGDVVTGTPATSPVNTPPTLDVDRLDKSGVLHFSISDTGGLAWQIQVFDVTDGKELAAITGTGDLSDQTFSLNPVNTYKLVPMVTTGGDRTNVGEPVWVGNKVGVND